MRKKGQESHSKQQAWRREIGISTPVLLPPLQSGSTTTVTALRGVYELLPKGRDKAGEVPMQRKKSKFMINGLEFFTWELSAPG